MNSNLPGRFVYAKLPIGSVINNQILQGSLEFERFNADP